MTQLLLTDDHKYFLGSRQLPGVTEVIGHFADRWIAGAGDWYLMRGRAVHRAIELALKDQLDWSSVDQRIQGRVRSILSFIQDLKLQRVDSERRLWSDRYQFAGTVDFVGMRGKAGDFVLCDWKSSPCPADELQVGGYSILWNERMIKREALSGAVIVQCHDDGHYKCRWLSRKELDRAAKLFLNMLTVWQWKKAQGYIE